MEESGGSKMYFPLSDEGGSYRFGIENMARNKYKLEMF